MGDEVEYIVKDDDGVIGVVGFKYDKAAARYIEEPTPEQFLSFDETVIRIIDTLADEDYDAMRTMKEDELILLHMSFGMWIRNSFGLWHENNPYTDVRAAGDSPKHADNYSFTIIEEVYQQIQDASSAVKSEILLP